MLQKTGNSAFFRGKRRILQCGMKICVTRNTAGPDDDGGGFGGGNDGVVVVDGGADMC